MRVKQAGNAGFPRLSEWGLTLLTLKITVSMLINNSVC